MKHDLFAEYADQWQGHGAFDQFAQVQLLAAALVSEKEKAKDRLKEWILKKKLDPYFQNQQKRYLDPLRIKADDLELDALPRLSFALRFDFHLRKPYLSKDEQDFYILDNPVHKDKVFKLPYVAPSSWKGSLRATLRMVLGLEDERQERDNQAMIRLFGPVKGESEEDRFRQGRLRFFPTFFDQIGLEVINPHPRDTGAGKQPIYIESVPPGATDATGTFTLLYVPFDRIGEDEAKTRAEVAEDLELVAQGLRAMFTQYGFGAKTSSGFGVAEDRVEGEIQLDADVQLEGENRSAKAQKELPVEPQVPEVVRKFREKYPGEDFTLTLKEWKQRHQTTNRQRDRYKEARGAYQEYQRELEAYRSQLEQERQGQAEEKAGRFQAAFRSFHELISLAERLAHALRERSDA